MDKKKFSFTYDGHGYMFWTWKGDYLNLGAGAELGIYNYSGYVGHYFADTKDKMPMAMTLRWKGKMIFRYGPVSAWWMNGFDPHYQNVLPRDLKASYTVYMTSHKQMFGALVKAYSKTGSGWAFGQSVFIASLVF